MQHLNVLMLFFFHRFWNILLLRPTHLVVLFVFVFVCCFRHLTWTENTVLCFVSSEKKPQSVLDIDRFVWKCHSLFYGYNSQSMSCAHAIVWFEFDIVHCVLTLNFAFAFFFSSTVTWSKPQICETYIIACWVEKRSLCRIVELAKRVHGKMNFVEHSELWTAFHCETISTCSSYVHETIIRNTISHIYQRGFDFGKSSTIVIVDNA